MPGRFWNFGSAITVGTAGGYFQFRLYCAGLFFAKDFCKTQMDSKAKTDVINSVTKCYNKNITKKNKTAVRRTDF